METAQNHEPWNKGKLVGQKAPLKLKDIWAIRIHLQLDQRIRHQGFCPDRVRKAYLAL